MADRSENQRGKTVVAVPMRWVAVLLAVVVAAAIGMATESRGVGYFGWRQVLYEPADLYVLNLSDQEQVVAIDGGESYRVGAQGARMLSLVGGTSSIAIDSQGAQGQSQTLEVEASGQAVLLNLSTQTCLAVAAVDEVSAQEPPEVEIIDLLDAERPLHVLDSRNVVWPRGYPGVLGEKPGPGRVVEVMDCVLREDPDFVADYLAGQLQQRMQ